MLNSTGSLQRPLPRDRLITPGGQELVAVVEPHADRLTRRARQEVRPLSWGLCDGHCSPGSDAPGLETVGAWVRQQSAWATSLAQNGEGPMGEKKTAEMLRQAKIAPAGLPRYHHRQMLMEWLDKRLAPAFEAALQNKMTLVLDNASCHLGGDAEVGVPETNTRKRNTQLLNKRKGLENYKSTVEAGRYRWKEGCGAQLQLQSASDWTVHQTRTSGMAMV